MYACAHTCSLLSQLWRCSSAFRRRSLIATVANRQRNRFTIRFTDRLMILLDDFRSPSFWRWRVCQWSHEWLFCAIFNQVFSSIFVLIWRRMTERYAALVKHSCPILSLSLVHFNCSRINQVSNKADQQPWQSASLSSSSSSYETITTPNYSSNYANKKTNQCSFLSFLLSAALEYGSFVSLAEQTFSLSPLFVVVVGIYWIDEPLN